MTTLLQDLRFTIRLLRRVPGFVLTVVMTLGIGLGLNTALFTLFNAYLLRPIAVRDPYSLYQLSATTKALRKGRNVQRADYTWDQYQAIRAMPVFSEVLATRELYARVAERNEDGALVSGNYFAMLGVRIALGRAILPDDAATPGSAAVVVLSNQLWKSAFAGDPGILGRKIAINGRPFEVIGVCGPDFNGMGESPEDFFVPATMIKALVPGPENLNIIGRLTPGMSLGAARAGLTLAVRHMTENLPEDDRAVDALLTSRATQLPMNPRMLAVFSPLIGAFVLVLVICCANAANMMLARAIGRQREIGVRLAIGASRARLIRQLLSEGLLLAALAGATAYTVAFFTIRGAQRLLVSTLPSTFGPLVRLAPLTLDTNVLLFLLLAAAAATIGSGLAPAIQATRLSLTEALRGEFSAGLRPQRLRHALVVCQITVCLLLLVITGQLVRSSSGYQHTETGLDLRGVVSPIFFGEMPTNFNARLFRYLSKQTWVESTAVCTRTPLSGGLRRVLITIPEKRFTEQAGFNFVSDGYFSLLRIPIVRGRNFERAEMESEGPVAIISQKTAQRYWPGQDAIGRTIEIGREARGGASEQPNIGQVTVVGVASDVVSALLMDGFDAAMIYLPTSASAKRAPLPLIRARIDSAVARNLLDEALRAVQPDRAAVVMSSEDGFAIQVYPFLAAAWIGTMLGAIALALSISGMYGVMSYLVTQRSREIGVRMALGASPGRVVKMILQQSGQISGIGIVIGLVLSAVSARLLTHIFFMIKMTDVLGWIGAVAIVTTAAVISAFIPARHASLIDPAETLRAE
jgi:predicted permease